MLFSIIVYMGLMSLMILSLKFSKLHLYPKDVNKSYPIHYLIIPCLLFAFIFGCRYNVGVDHLTYLQNYLYFPREYEPGFALISDFCTKNNLHFAIFFGIIAFIQIFFFLLAFRNKAYLYPYILMILFLSCIELNWMNGIRQSIAACIFIYATNFIEKKQSIKYIIAILIAMQFHSSAILLLPIYFITYLPILKNKWISIGIYLAALFVNTLPLEHFGLLFINASELLGYDEIYNEDTLEAYDVKAGLGRFILNITFFIIILYSQKLKNFFKKDERWFNIMYNLYIIGMFGDIAFNKVNLLNRPFEYFKAFWTVLAAMMIYYLITTKKNRTMLFIFISLFALTFLAKMLKGSSNYMEFHFFWENFI